MSSTEVAWKPFSVKHRRALSTIWRRVLAPRVPTVGLLGP